jgi:hypothetical protein
MSSNESVSIPPAEHLLFLAPGGRLADRVPALRIIGIASLCLIFVAGIFLRLPPSLFVGERASLHALAAVHPNPGFGGVGYDENLYRRYVDELARQGVTAYPDLAEGYIAVQARLPGAILPPTRFVYVFSGYLWKLLCGGDSLAALHNISSLFSILLLLLSAIFAWRLGGPVMTLGVTALMAVAPTQIHMSQHALIDGVFAFWATLSLWLLWENLHHPDRPGWLIAYGASLAVMVLTKENAMFAYVGLCLILGLNRWARFGTLTRSLLGMTIAGPLAGVVFLIFLCGGADTFYHVYRLLVSKASVLPYAIATGDGPWYRYLVDLLLVSPITFLLACGAIFRVRAADRAAVFLIIFVVGSYLIMCNVRYGMNLRYANMWDLPLRYLAVVCVSDLVRSLRWRSDLLFGGGIAFLCAFDLRQYRIFFVEHNLYELVTGGLLHALRILK